MKKELLQLIIDNHGTEEQKSLKNTIEEAYKIGLEEAGASIILEKEEHRCYGVVDKYSIVKDSKEFYKKVIDENNQLKEKIQDMSVLQNQLHIKEGQIDKLKNRTLLQRILNK